MRDHLNEYDTLFIGSSRMYHQIIPALFDDLMTQRGKPTHSFNVGVDGMRPPEDSYVFDEILDFRPNNLRFVFVELAGMRLSLDSDKRGTIRSVYWHDWERLSMVFRRAIYLKKKYDFADALEELREPLGDFADHLELFARNMTNVGRSEVLMSRLWEKRPQQRPESMIGERRDGYIVADFPQVMPPDVRADYERELAARKAKPANKDPGDPISQEALKRMVDKILRLGATPVLIVPPTTNKKNFEPRPEIARKALVFDFSDLQRYPGLFENQHRQDTDHVNAAGADLFTRLLVDEFTDRLSTRE
ncbi:hypothetical protein ACXR0O_26170 [Verrucomicrobiota bacterium sgz303538]